MVRKISSFLAALLVISLLTFLLTKIASSDPAENYLRASKITITQESLEHARQYLGLDRSWTEQYILWLGKALQGDFGRSYLWKEDALPLVWTSFLSTLHLAVVAFLLIVGLSLPLGIVSGLLNGSFIERFIRFLTFSSVSMPTFWIGYLLMLVFSVHLKWLPVSGKSSINSVILPSITLSIPLIGQYVALIRQAVVEQLETIYVQNALLRGVRMSYIIPHYLVRNSLPAMVTGLSLTMVYLLTGSVIIEEVFAWNGIGSLFVQALQAVDVPVIQTSMLLFGFLFLLNHLVMEQVTGLIDPRLRKTRGSK